MPLNRRQFLQGMGTAMLAGACTMLPTSITGLPAKAEEVRFVENGRCRFGDWWCETVISAKYWQPGDNVQVTGTFYLSPEVLPAMAAAEAVPQDFALLITSERTFDASGLLRLPADERMSTLLTPAGLAIEGGNGSAISKKIGIRYVNPIDVLLKLPGSSLQQKENAKAISFSTGITLPVDMPPGMYRLRFDFGIYSGKKLISFNKEGFANRPQDLELSSLLYSPLLFVSGKDVNGKYIAAETLKPHIYWILLAQYNSNGYQGVVAEEDKGHFALSGRNIIPDEVILPLYDPRGNVSSYNLEPMFIADTIDKQRNIPWNVSSGQLSIRVVTPDGQTVDLGTAPFTAEKDGRPVTGNTRFTAWKPTRYGRYTVVARGWIQDRWGNRYEGGGTYHFWLAKRLTMGTATFQGMAFPVGARYGRDIGFAPAVPADVTVKVDLYPNSDKSAVKTLTYGGKASEGGTFGAAQGLKGFELDAPGEYHAQVLATYTDADGHLWVCSMRHAGAVYPLDTPLVAHGKKLKIQDRFLERGETHYEGYIEPNDQFRHLDHINFPYQNGDVLLIASEGQGTNKIEPVLTYELAGENQAYDAKLQAVGATNARIQTINGFSPHLYPEYITDYCYYYAAAPRPGLSGRFLVGEDGVRAPYWPTSQTSFGGQIGASANGDFTGEIYRLLGGVVLRRQQQTPLYAGYLASAFILPKDTKNNRVIAAGAEELTGADGGKSRFFLVPTRPGMVYEEGGSFTAALQIDPILPARVAVSLTFPDGRVKTVEGTGDHFGLFVGSQHWLLDVPGVYVYKVRAEWEGHKGAIAGLPDNTGYLFVKEKNRPPIRLDLKNQQYFTVEEGLKITGHTTAEQVYYTVVMPGAVVEQGVLKADGGSFLYHFAPVAVNKRLAIYDIANVRTGRKEIGRVVHLTFFAREKDASGKEYHAFARVILRGATAIYTA